MIRIAIIEDDEAVSDNYKALIEAAWASEVEVDQLFNLHQAKTALDRGNYDLISLDLQLGDELPSELADLEGLKLLADMDRNTRATVLVVSGAAASVSQYLNLLSVMDTLGKPHEAHEYLKAVRMGLEVQGKLAVAKNTLSKTGIRAGELTIDPLQGPPTWKGKKLEGCTLTHQRILYKLVTSTPEAVPVKNLLEALPAYRPSRESLNTHVSEIRKLLRSVGQDTELIRTEAGSYRWVGN